MKLDLHKKHRHEKQIIQDEIKFTVDSDLDLSSLV